jgi:heme O synthase-like polyprenyltransferase
MLYAAALVPTALLPAIDLAGTVYLGIAFGLSLALFGLAVVFARSRSDGSARLLFYGTITYLPLLWAAMILDH